MRRFNHKGAAFWAAMFGVATCTAFDNTKGCVAFALLAVAILVLG
jgi:hypothetical protein